MLNGRRNGCLYVINCYVFLSIEFNVIRKKKRLLVLTAYLEERVCSRVHQSMQFLCTFIELKKIYVLLKVRRCWLEPPVKVIILDFIQYSYVRCLTIMLEF